jgi:hypothetical protein
MAGPWEKYATPAPAAAPGPWSKYAAPEQPAAPQVEQEPSQGYSGSILPLSKDAEGNVSFDSNAGIVGAIKRAVMLPGEAMAGNIDPGSQEAIERSAEFAGVFGPMSAASGTGKAIAANAPRVERPGMEAAAAAERLNIPLPRAVASDSTSVQQTGKILTNVPIGGTPLRKASQTAIEQLGQAADDVQKSVGTGNVANAGAAAREGIAAHTKALGSRVSDAYNNVDSLVTQNVTTPLSETAKVALDISGRRANAKLPESAAIGRVRQALDTPDGLNYQGIKDLRTSVGEILDNPSLLPADMSEAELRRIYGSLTADLKNAVSRSGGEKASQAFEAANQLAAKTAREREGLQKVLGRDISDERLFDRVTAMAGGNSRADRVSLARVKGAVGDDTWKEISSGVISRLGRDADGNFSPDRFISGYGKISPEGKQALFGKGELASSLDDIAAVSRRFKQMNQYANPSGTGQTVIGGALIPGLYAEPMTTISTVVGSRLLSSALAKPVSAKALAAYSRAYSAHATTPSNASLRALENTSRAVAALIANEAGDRSVAAQIFPAISRVQELPAEQGNENQRAPEGQQTGVQGQPRMLLPNEL